MKNVAIIGAGPAGLFVAGLLAKQNCKVCVFEKNDRVGKKLFITGKGRCNLTNLTEPDEFLKNVVRGDKFLRTAIYNFSSFDAVDYFNSLGLETKVERGNRVFPVSDKAADVVDVLKNVHCKNVEFSFNDEVVALTKKDDGFLVVSKKGKRTFDSVIIATGGLSYKATGCDGAGYKFAKIFGHNIEKVVPALSAIKLKDSFISKLQGVSLKNVQLDCVLNSKKKSFFGEMLFTDCGISGPIVLTASSYLNRVEDVEMSLDLKPALSFEQLDARVLRDFEENKNKDLRNVLKGLLPKAVADIFCDVSKLDENKKVHDITKEERKTLVDTLKKFPLTFSSLYDIDAAIVSSGGVDIKEINPKTFESKIVPGLYFLGEVLDVDALTGGYNLQICWASAFSLAKHFVC